MSEKSLIVTGLRGVGKTVLLNTFEGIAEDAGFKTAKTEITHETDFAPMISRMVRRTLLSLSTWDRMKERTRRAAGVLKAFNVRFPDGPEFTFDVDAIVGLADSGNLAEDLSDLLVALGEAARDHDTGVVFLFDEIQFLKRLELEALIAALHQIAQRSLPITLVGAGLPQLPALVGIAKSYAERLFDFPMIGKLELEAARQALELPAQQQGISLEPAATEAILEYTEGYPYFLQEYGKHVWNMAHGTEITLDDVEAAAPVVQLQLDDNFFRVRVGRATTAELKYLSAMASLGSGPFRSGEIATKLHRPGPESVAPTRARLIEKGLIFSPGHGLNEFTVPQFDGFLRRMFPLEDWQN
jgi:hypothetical protein